MVSDTALQSSRNIMGIKITIFLAGLFLLILFFPRAAAQFPKTASCQNPDFDKKVNSYLSYTVPVIDVEKAFFQSESMIFLDAREKQEFSVSHIPGARFVGFDEFSLSNNQDLPKDKIIVVYCSIGYRSEKIAEKLRKAGYQKVYNLYGSIFEWVNRGFPVVNDQGQVTQVHGYNKKWSQWITRTGIQKIY